MSVRTRTEKRPDLFRGVGIKFYADEWPIVEALMEKKGQNITDLLKSSVAKEAARHGLIFPRYGVPEEVAS